MTLRVACRPARTPSFYSSSTARRFAPRQHQIRVLQRSRVQPADRGSRRTAGPTESRSDSRRRDRPNGAWAAYGSRTTGILLRQVGCQLTRATLNLAASPPPRDHDGDGTTEDGNGGRASRPSRSDCESRRGLTGLRRLLDLRRDRCSSDYRPVTGTVTSGPEARRSPSMYGDTTHERTRLFVRCECDEGTIAHGSSLGTSRRHAAPPPRSAAPPFDSRHLPTEAPEHEPHARRASTSTVDVSLECGDNQSGVDGSHLPDGAVGDTGFAVKGCRGDGRRNHEPIVATAVWSISDGDNPELDLYTHLGPLVIVPRPRCIVADVRV